MKHEGNDEPIKIEIEESKEEAPSEGVKLNLIKSESDV